MRILIANRYVSPTYAAMRLKFYIEVKTTTSRNHEAFYMSSGQYERVRSRRLKVIAAMLTLALDGNSEEAFGNSAWTSLSHHPCLANHRARSGPEYILRSSYRKGRR